jgi:hypothetical protein
LKNNLAPLALLLKKTVVCVVLVSCFTLAAPPAAPAQTPAAESPAAVVRGFYDWYLGSLNREDYNPLKRRSEALRFMTPQFHRQAPRIIERQMVDIFICAQDWQPEWGNDLAISADPPRGPRARVTATFKYGGDAYTRVRLTLLRVGRAWKINGADCGE